MSIIYLVRHTKYSNPRNILPGRLPVELSEKGIEQAYNLRDYFSDKNIHTIYSSSILRCLQTSEIIANNTTPIEYDSRLTETLSAAQGAIKSKAWRITLYDQVVKLGGESPEDVQNRMIDFWKTTRFDPDHNYIVCSHGDPLLFLYQFLSGKSLYVDRNINEPDEYQQKGSVRIVEYKGLDNLILNSCILNENL